MKVPSIVAGAIAACVVNALPTHLEARQSTNIDTTVLQFALTVR